MKKLVSILTSTTLIAGVALVTATALASGLEHISSWGSGEFTTPIDIISDGNNVWVADSMASTVSKYTSTGTLLLEFGSPGGSPGQFIRAAAVAVDPSGNVWVGEDQQPVDIGNRVQKFRLGNCSGQEVQVAPGVCYVTEFRIYGNVQSITTDLSGNVYVVNSSYPWIEKFTNDGTLVARFFPSGVCQNCSGGQWDLDVDADGNIWVMNGLTREFQEYTTDWTLVSEIPYPDPNPDGASFMGIDVTESGITAVGNQYAAIIDFNGTIVSKYGDGIGEDETYIKYSWDLVNLGSELLLTNGNSKQIEVFGVGSSPALPTSCDESPTSVTLSSANGFKDLVPGEGSIYRPNVAGEGLKSDPTLSFVYACGPCTAMTTNLKQVLTPRDCGASGDASLMVQKDICAKSKTTGKFYSLDVTAYSIQTSDPNASYVRTTCSVPTTTPTPTPTGEYKDILTFSLQTLGQGAAQFEGISGKELRVFNVDDPAFVTAYGSSFASWKSKLDEIYAGSTGKISYCTTDSDGACTALKAAAGNYLVVGMYVDGDKAIYTSKNELSADFNADKENFADLKIVKKYKADGTVEFGPGGQVLVTTAPVSSVDGNMLVLVALLAAAAGVGIGLYARNLKK